MPGSLITDMEQSSNESEEHRAIKLALELSWLNLNSDEDQVFGESRTKKSMNMTECVPVPSSEHVAEIVGRQGCKIKALRAKTNTYIKTPVRGEEPVFVVTGRKEDVALAKREILQAAEHFSQIRASRRNSTGLQSLGPSSPTPPGHVKKLVRVPYKVVGLVVGPKGATIKRIQQTTNTYIVTPSRDKEPVFEVTGSPDDVDKAKKEIEHHIAQRTGGFSEAHPENGDSQFFNGFPGNLFSPTNHRGFSAFLDHQHRNHHHHHHQHHSGPANQQSDNFYFGTSNVPDKFSNLGSVTSPFSNNNGFPFENLISPTSTDLASPTSSAFDPTPGSPAPSVWPDLRNTVNRIVGSQAPSLARSTSVSHNGLPNGNDSGRTSPDGHSNGHQQARRFMSEPFGDSFTPMTTCYTPFNPSETVTSSIATNGVLRNDSIVSSPFNDLISTQIDIQGSGSLGTDSDGSKNSTPENSWKRPSFQGLAGIDLSQRPKKCFVCQSSEVVAALVPCGHNLFCMECAQNLKDEEDGKCPACNQKVEQVLRIFS